MAELITFEGLHGSGKTTISDLFCAYLDDCNFTFTSTREPGSTGLGEKLRELVLHSSVDICPTSMLHLFLADRSQHIEEKIEKWKNDNSIDFIVCDRYIDSTIAHQSISLPKSVVKPLALMSAKNIFPKLTFWLDVSFDQMKKRLLGNERDRFEYMPESVFNQIRNNYMELHQYNKKRIVRINANNDTGKVFYDVCKMFAYRYSLAERHWNELPSYDVSDLEPAELPEFSSLKFT